MKKLVVILCLASSATAQLSEAKPWLGMALLLRNGSSGEKFLYVAHAPEGTPAFQAGVRPGDLIVRIAGKPIEFRDDLDIIEFTSSLTPGKALKLRLIRAGREQNLRILVGTLPKEYEPLQAETLRKAREARARKPR